MSSLDLDIAITTDRSMMTNHHGREFLGFMATAPAYGIPESWWMYICCPKPKVDRFGRPREAPYGLRKIEAALIDAGYKAAIIDPDYLDRYVEKAKILMIGHHDFFAYGPPSSEWWLLTGKEPVNRKSFIRLMESDAVRAMKKRGVKIVVGGPAAWQWLWEPELVERWGIDVIVDGEADIAIIEIVEKLLNNEKVPRYISIGAREVPPIEKIPIIKGASVNGLIEITRGCPRGCKFCSVTLRPLRHMPIERILKEIDVNISNGVKGAVLHSEDVLLYGAHGVEPNADAVLKLHEAVVKKIESLAWAHASLAAIVVSQRKYRLISRVTETIYSNLDQNYLGVEVGIETGSPRLAKIIMPAKALPFRVEEWPDIVEEAFSIMHDHRIIPAATFILGLPGEEPDDVVKTIELLDRLKKYRSLIVPMLFVPMGALKSEEGGIVGMRITPEHAEAMKIAFWHTVKWAEDIIANFYMKGLVYEPVKILLRIFLWFARRKMKDIEKKVLPRFTGKDLGIHEEKEYGRICGT
ncbi:Radical SAM domain protein [Ignisphaera aggregans DSM 17230]|uniref:Radical SAM domain protein n=1 Tax=Ignisphaera aggregans (strain DSM 17230 / JCM 13409 / AQ1.S1) TaxID=583356 RepID=E0SRP2_IGNAA|nr:Radical SAM domain protein [Ignisphaera aggregans DSM 17230]